MNIIEELNNYEKDIELELKNIDKIVLKNSINILTNIYICSIMISDRKISM